MPVIFFPITPLGAIVDAFVQVSSPRFDFLTKSKIATPNPQRVRALLDTGASGTCIDPTILNALQLAPTGQTMVHTPSTGATPHPCNMYDVAILIPHPSGVSHFTLEAIPVIESDLAIQGIQALFGRNVLTAMQFIYNCSPNQFSIAY